jgi:DNA-binding transcriptional LysR family regulator
MNFDLVTVRAFLAVVEQRHYGRAAEALGVSVSAVTKRVQRLEADLGVPLLERDSGGVVDLTPAGRRFVQFAPQVLQSAQEAQMVVTDGATMTLRIGVPAGVPAVAPLMPSALATLELALSHAHPGVVTALKPTPFQRLTADLLDSTVDVLLTFGESPNPGIESTRLGELHRVGMVAATHAYAFRAAVDVREFATQPMVYSPDLPDEYMHPFVLADVRPLADARLSPLNASSTAQVAQRVLGGRDVTVVPAALTANLPPELKRVRLDGVPPCWYFAQRRRDDDRPALETLIDLLVAFTESITRAALH